MIKTKTFTYIVLLLVAFVIGLFGTLAVSHAVIQKWGVQSQSIEQPASNQTTPKINNGVNTIEC
ncbi:MAG: hypothetical protein JW841_17305 [Deltaproteobacteria bacterium]|nr:hypothetical protein [Deltaproteobacteria bacterium]